MKSKGIKKESADKKVRVCGGFITFLGGYWGNLSTLS